MELGGVTLKDFSTLTSKVDVDDPDDKSAKIKMENPILTAARAGDAGLLRELLREKTEDFLRDPTQRIFYPKHWKFHFENLLLETDEDGRTALHLAATVGNPEMSLDCVMAILESVQLYVPEKEVWTDTDVKQDTLVNVKDREEQTALHLAIENRAAKVVAYLLDNQADMMAKAKCGTPALSLIYEHLPEAMTSLYDEAVQLTDDYRGFNIDWGPVIGTRFMDSSASGQSSSGGNNGTYEPVPEPFCESENLKYVLSWDQWGAPILSHELVKLYLEKKWERIQWFFWITFGLEMFWLLLYTGAFMSLNLAVRANRSEEDCVSGSLGPSLACRRGYHVWWAVVMVFTVLCGAKEVYQLMVLGHRAYWSFENIIQNVFIVLVFAQFGWLMAGYPSVVASVSVIGTILGTTLMVFQVGKMPYFGRQVAAWKKVIYSFAPHLPVFIIWFAGFGVIFWAVLYKAEESWLFNMVAIMAAMGTGELNAEEHLKSGEEDGEDSDMVKASVRVLALLFFVIIIVTLYFNLLIGYAVSDIQILKAKAETLELSNKLSTIYSIESFLISKPGRLILQIKWKLGHWLGFSTANVKNALDSIFVVPMEDFIKNDGEQRIRFDEVPPKLLKPLKDLAYRNNAKNKERDRLEEQKLKELIGVETLSL